MVGDLRRTRAVVMFALLQFVVACSSSPRSANDGLEVFNAASLGPPFRDALAEFGQQVKGLQPAQHNAPSLEVVRMLTELGRVPDVLAVADHALLDSLVVPKHSDWYVLFGSNAMVLAYGPRSRYRDEITTDNWWEVVQRDDVEVGRSDMNIDPSGYRADMVMQLAERFYGRPGLTERLRARIPGRNVRRAEADLSALIEAGELDYGWTYESLARAHGLKYVNLPSAIDLSDAAADSSYRAAVVRLPATKSRPALELRGAAIVFGLTIPRDAPHPNVAARFVSFLLSPAGQGVLRRSGFVPLSPPIFRGTPPAAVVRGG